MSNRKAIEKALRAGLQNSAELLQLVFEDAAPDLKLRVAKHIALGASMRVIFDGLPHAPALVVESRDPDGTLHQVVRKEFKA